MEASFKVSGLSSWRNSVAVTEMGRPQSVGSMSLWVYKPALFLKSVSLVIKVPDSFSTMTGLFSEAPADTGDVPILFIKWCTITLPA